MRKMKFMLLFITQIYLFGTSLNFPCMMNFTPEWIYKPKSYSEKKIEIAKINSKICKNSKDVNFFGDFELDYIELNKETKVERFIVLPSKIEKEYAYVPLLDSQKLEKEPLYVTIFTGNQKNRLYNQIEKEYPLLDIPKMKKEPLYTTKFIENKEIKYRVYNQIERKIKEINDKFKILISFDKLENQQGSFVLPYVLKPSYSDFEYIDSEYLIVTMGKYFYVIDLKKVEMEHKEVDEDILKLLEIMKMLKF